LIDYCGQDGYLVGLWPTLAFAFQEAVAAMRQLSDALLCSDCAPESAGKIRRAVQ
jgi:hypothetical protein